MSTVNIVTVNREKYKPNMRACDLTIYAQLRFLPKQLLDRVVKFFIYGPEGYYKSVLFWTDEDRVFAYGQNAYGMLGIGHQNNVPMNCRVEPVEVVELSGQKVVEMSHGSEHVMALTADRRLLAWGRNDRGQLGLQCNQTQLRPKLVGEGFVTVSCGEKHTVAITTQGYAMGWGCNRYGALGHGIGSEVHLPTRLDSLTNVSSVHCGQRNTVILCHPLEQRPEVYFLNRGNMTQKMEPVPETVNLDTVAVITQGRHFWLATKQNLILRINYDQNERHRKVEITSGPWNEPVEAMFGNYQLALVGFRFESGRIMGFKNRRFIRPDHQSIVDFCFLYGGESCIPTLAWCNAESGALCYPYERFNNPRHCVMQIAVQCNRTMFINAASIGERSPFFRANLEDESPPAELSDDWYHCFFHYLRFLVTNHWHMVDLDIAFDLYFLGYEIDEPEMIHQASRLIMARLEDVHSRYGPEVFTAYLAFHLREVLRCRVDDFKEMIEKWTKANPRITEKEHSVRSLLSYLTTHQTEEELEARFGGTIFANLARKPIAKEVYPSLDFVHEVLTIGEPELD